MFGLRNHENKSDRAMVVVLLGNEGFEFMEEEGEFVERDGASLGGWVSHGGCSSLGWVSHGGCSSHVGCHDDWI